MGGTSSVEAVPEHRQEAGTLPALTLGLIPLYVMPFQFLKAGVGTKMAVTNVVVELA